MLKTKEVAKWLANSDALGSTDDEFIEVFALLNRIWESNGRDKLENYDPEWLILNLNVKGICSKLEKILLEIQENIKDRK